MEGEVPRAISITWFARCGNYERVILAFAILGILCSSVGHSFMFAPYNARICDDLGISRAFVTSIWTIALLAAAGWVNVVGRLADRYGARPLIFGGGCLEALALVCFGLARGPLGIAFGYCLVRASSVETVDFACRHTINHWFSGRRGIAAGVLNALGAVMMLLPAGETLFIGVVGWRATAVGVGVVAGSLLVLCSVFLLSKPPSTEPGQAGTDTPSLANSCDGEAAEALESFTFEEAVRTKIFWLLVQGYFSALVPWAGINFLLVDILEEAGHSQNDAVFVYVPLSAMSAASSVLCGSVIDKIPMARRQMPIAVVNGAMLMVVLSGAALDLLPGFAGPAFLGAALGCFQGSSNVVSTAIVPSLFGQRYQGAIRGLFITIIMVPSAVGPALVAFVREFGFSFRGIFLILAACQVATMATVSFVGPPRRRHPLRELTVSMADHDATLQQSS